MGPLRMRYRHGREVTVDEYFSLLRGAGKAIEDQFEKLEQDLDFVKGLEREDAESTNNIVNIEHELASLKRRAAKTVLGEDI